jgi:hypothetical protein
MMAAPSLSWFFCGLIGVNSSHHAGGPFFAAGSFFCLPRGIPFGKEMITSDVAKTCSKLLGIKFCEIDKAAGGKRLLPACRRPFRLS